MKIPQKEIQVEDEEELVMEMEEIGKHSKEPLKMTDKMEIGQYQPMWREGMIQDRNLECPLLLYLRDFVTDWSSLGSPLARTTPHSVSNREMEQNVNISNQLNVQSGTVPREETTRATSQEEVIISPQISQQSEEQNVQMIEMEPNPLNIEVRTQRDGIGTDRESNVPIIQPSGNMIPLTGLGEPTLILNVSMGSENNFETLRDSHLRSQEQGLQEILVIPPVDRLTLIPSRDRRIISNNSRIG